MAREEVQADSEEKELEKLWKKGPLPSKSYFWGGVVPVKGIGLDTRYGFLFADFCGDTVKLVGQDRVLLAHEVAWYNNNIGLPPRS